MTYHQAIDLAIMALDQERQKLTWSGPGQGMAEAYAKRYNEINQAIKLLTTLKDRVGPDGTERMF